MSPLASNSILPSTVSHEEIDQAVIKQVHHTGDGGERGADHEGHGDGAIDIDAEQRGHGLVLLAGAHVAAQPRARDQPGEQRQQHDGGDDDDDLDVRKLHHEAACTLMYEFKYHRPATVRQAANLLVKNEDAKLIAGGHTLVPVMKQRLASPPHLVDLSHIEGLDEIEMKGRSLVIGATAKHAAVATSAIVGEAIPALAELAGMIGDPAVRHKGTIGGSLANNDPTADYPAAVLALGATIVTNKRRLKAEEFFQGLFTTALESDEIVTRVMFPLAKKAAYVKFRNQASRYALVGVFVARRPSDVRVAVTGAGSDGVFRVTEFEEALKKRFSSKVLEGLSVSADGLNSDLHGSAEYRAHLIGVLARRAVDAANNRA